MVTSARLGCGDAKAVIAPCDRWCSPICVLSFAWSESLSTVHTMGVNVLLSQLGIRAIGVAANVDVGIIYWLVVRMRTHVSARAMASWVEVTWLHVWKDFRESLAISSNSFIGVSERKLVPDMVVYLLSIHIDDILFAWGTSERAEMSLAEHCIIDRIITSLSC